MCNVILKISDPVDPVFDKEFEKLLDELGFIDKEKEAFIKIPKNGKT